MNLYRELFEPVGVTFGSVSPKGSAALGCHPYGRRPSPRHKTHAFRAGCHTATRACTRCPGDLTVDTSPFHVHRMLSGSQLRDPFDERWSPTDENGHFIVYPTDDSYLLAILHPSGFAIQSGASKNVVFRLQPWATISLSSTGDVAEQLTNVSISPTGAKPEEAGFAIYSIETKGKPVEVKVPAGVIVVSRSLAMRNGMSVLSRSTSFPSSREKLCTLALKPPSDADRNVRGRSPRAASGHQTRGSLVSV